MSGSEITDGSVRVREPPSAQEGLYGSLVALNPPHTSESHRVARPIQPSICRMSCRRGLEVMFRCAGAAKPATRRSSYVLHRTQLWRRRSAWDPDNCETHASAAIPVTRFATQSPCLKLVPGRPRAVGALECGRTKSASNDKLSKLL